VAHAGAPLVMVVTWGAAVAPVVSWVEAGPEAVTVVAHAVG